MIILSCGSPQNNGVTSNYFQLPQYFKNEAERLQSANPQITKSVAINGVSEQKTIHVDSWEKELASFIDADINKPAWKGLFKVQRSESTDIYTTNSTKVPVKKVSITKADSNKVKRVQIIVENKNALYTSIDTLTYFPDSRYEINRTQKIRLMGQKKYLVSGRW